MRTSRLAAFAALALLATQAVADTHIREYVIPFVPGTDRAAYRNTVITVTNHQPEAAPISIFAHVNRSGSAQSCGSLRDLAPYEIRRFHRNAGSLCVASDEGADSSLRIRTVEGVHVEGFQVLAANRGNAFVPINVISTEPLPFGPDGISISTLTLHGTTERNVYRLSVRIRSSSGAWPGPMVACIQARHNDPHYTGLNDNPALNCSLPAEQLRGWVHGSGHYGTGAPRPNRIQIVTHDGTRLSEVASADYRVQGYFLRDPLTYRACIHRAPVDGLLPAPITCETVTPSVPQADTAQAGG